MRDPREPLKELESDRSSYSSRIEFDPVKVDESIEDPNFECALDLIFHKSVKNKKKIIRNF